MKNYLQLISMRSYRHYSVVFWMTKGIFCSAYINSSVCVCVGYVSLIFCIPNTSTSIYLELCIKTVLNLYKNLPNPPTSVSIVSHSMVCPFEFFSSKNKNKSERNCCGTFVRCFRLFIINWFIFVFFFFCCSSSFSRFIFYSGWKSGTIGFDEPWNSKACEHCGCDSRTNR